MWRVNPTWECPDHLRELELTEGPSTKFLCGGTSSIKIAPHVLHCSVGSVMKQCKTCGAIFTLQVPPQRNLVINMSSSTRVIFKDRKVIKLLFG